MNKKYNFYALTDGPGVTKVLLQLQEWKKAEYKEVRGSRVQDETIRDLMEGFGQWKT